jgi:D-alanine-D-alanine ligase
MKPEPDRTPPRKIRVAVLMGGPSPEREVSLDSGTQVIGALDPDRFDVLPVEITRRGEWLPRPDLLKLSAGSVTPSQAEKGLSQRDPAPFAASQPIDPAQAQAAQPDPSAGSGLDGDDPAAGREVVPVPRHIDDVVGEGSVDVAFIAMHGPYGEDGTVQGLLELLGIPYTGSGVLASALAMDKLRSRQVLQANDVPVPAYVVVDGGRWPKNCSEIASRVGRDLGYPCVTKPNAVGSSIGVTIVPDEPALAGAIESALVYGDVVLVEEYLRGTELTCAVLEEAKTGVPSALPVIEILPKRAFFDYAAKYQGASEEIVPARIPPEVARRVQQIAVRVHRILGCEGFSRIDMFAAGEHVVVLEANTIPGMTAGSLIPLAARAGGIVFPELLSRMIASALRRDRIRKRRRNT